MNLSLNHALSRRTFLRGAGVCVALPLLDAMVPAILTPSVRAAQSKIPRRMVAIETNMGSCRSSFSQRNRAATTPPARISNASPRTAPR